MSLINMNPTKATFWTDGSFNRRRALGFGAGALVAGTAGSALGAAEPAKGKLKLDFTKPEDNLTAWVKLAASLDSGSETCGYYKGEVALVTSPDQKNIPLFGYEGFGMSRVTKMPDGRWQNLHREISYYTDLRSGAILTEWKNPFSNETVKVYPTTNDPVNSYYSTEFKQTFGEAGKQETVTFPFILPWDIFDDRVVATFTVHTRWPSPFKKEKWPREYIGEWYKTSEMFQIHTRLSDLEDPSKPKAYSTGAWFKEAPLMPWMLMDNAPARLVYNTRTFGLKSTADLPAKIREYTEKNYPKYLNAPDKWVEPNMTTFETWVTLMTPAPAKKGSS
ncbi:MAG: DUF1838 family protein [Rhodospirillaceae bacterium]|nr:DUF1838 family protein [Rhodospirillaceae bacterium]